MRGDFFSPSKGVEKSRDVTKESEAEYRIFRVLEQNEGLSLPCVREDRAQNTEYLGSQSKTKDFLFAMRARKSGVEYRLLRNLEQNEGLVNCHAYEKIGLRKPNI